MEEKKQEDRVVRILSTDIEGKMKVYAGLTKIKGISWAVSNAVCEKCKINKNKKIGALTESEIKQISEIIKKSDFPNHLINRRNDFEEGKKSHFIGSDLDLRKEFDIKRLKKIKSYKGIRHVAGLPLRGQRTKSHFRKNRRKGSGIKKKGEKNEKKA
jgi:small subunit ribosomal protein S13